MSTTPTPALAALRDALLDHAKPTPEAALATARALLAAHARELAAALTEESGSYGHPGYDYETGPGMAAAADRLDEHAAQLDTSETR